VREGANAGPATVDGVSDPGDTESSQSSAGLPRYRCDGCGNLTRFDVTVVQRSKAFHHFTVGGDLVIEEEEVMSRHVDEVVCRWCGHGRSVVEISDEHTEPGAPSKVP
jgi:hypothetical protein